MDKPHNSEIPIAEVLRLITTLASPDRSVLVGIDGGAGAGKSTFTTWFAEAIEESANSVSLVHTDSFYRPSAERGKALAGVEDLDWERLRDQVLVPLQAGRAACFQLYDWPEDRLKEWMTINVGGVVIVDGIVATRRELADYYDLRIWFTCLREVRVSRLLGRGDTPAEEIEHWLPSEERYIASHAPEERAHLVVDSAANVDAKDGTGWLAKRWSPPNSA